MRNHNRLYTLLNVLPDADPVVIEAAYKALMKRHHPDIAAEGTTGGRAADLNQAYQTLRDPQRRAAYDADERARQERHRAEVARAMNASARQAAPPPPRPASVRVGQRAAAWLALAGILFLAGAIYLLARGADAPAPARAPQAQTADSRSPAELRQAAAAFRDQPVDRSEVDKALGEFRRIAGSAGLPGVAAYSEHCFDVHSRTLAANDFDHCVAFDHVASRLDLRPASAQAARPEPRFQPESLVPRHIRAAERVGADPSLIEARLFEIRRLTDSAASRPDAVQLGAAATPPAPAPAAVPLDRTAPRQTAQRAAPPRRRQPPPQRRRTQAEQDFLEREGGIY